MWDPEDPSLPCQSPLEVSRASDASRKFRVFRCFAPSLRATDASLHYACTAQNALRNVLGLLRSLVTIVLVCALRPKIVKVVCVSTPRCSGRSSALVSIRAQPATRGETRGRLGCFGFVRFCLHKNERNPSLE